MVSLSCCQLAINWTVQI